MTVALVVLILIVALVVLYVWGLRSRLREHPWFDPFYDWIEPIERVLWAKSRTLLIARLYSLVGFLISIQALLQESGVDWIGLIPIPGEYAKWIGPTVWVTGLLFGHLRKITAVPLEERKEGA